MRRRGDSVVGQYAHGAGDEAITATVEAGLLLTGSFAVFFRVDAIHHQRIVNSNLRSFDRVKMAKLTWFCQYQSRKLAIELLNPIFSISRSTRATC